MADKTIEIRIRSKLEDSGAFSSVLGSLQRIGEFAIGGLLTRGLSAIGNSLVGMTQNAIGAAGEMQNLGLALEGLVAREMSGGLERVQYVSEEMVKSLEDATAELNDLNQEQADKQAELQAELSQELLKLAEETNKRQEELLYDHQKRVSDIRQDMSDLDADYEYDRAERAEDLTRDLTRSEEDYNHKREGLLKDLADAETEAEQQRIQERIDELDYEYELRRKRKIEDAEERDQDAKDALKKRKAELERRLAEEDEAYQRQRSKIQEQNAERMHAVSEHYQKEVEEINKRYDAEIAKAKEAAEAIQAEIDKIQAQQIDTGPVMSLEDALAQAGPKADELLEWLRKLSIQSPFQYNQIADIFRFQMAMGGSTEEAKSLTASMANMAAGMGLTGDAMNRVSYNMAQAILQGDLTEVNFRQLRMAGVDLASILEGELGMSIDDIRAKMKSGELSTKDLVDAFSGYADKNFAGAATRMSRTLTGIQSSFNDLFFFAGADLLTPAIEVVSDTLGELFDAANEMMESGQFKVIGEQIGEMVQKVIDFATTYGPEVFATFQRIGAYIKDPLIPSLMEAYRWFSEELLPVLKEIWASITQELLPALGKVLVSFGLLEDQNTDVTLQSVADAIVNVANAVNNVIGPIASFIGKAAELDAILRPLYTAALFPMVTVVKDLWQNFVFAKEHFEKMGGVIPAIQAAFEDLTKPIQNIIDKIGELIGKLKDLVIPDILQQHSPSQLEQSFLDLSSAIRGVSDVSLPGFSGGMGRAAAMAPAYAPAGGGRTVVVNINAPIMGFNDAYGLGRELAPIIDEHLRKK